MKILITGASRGLGAAIARKFVNEQNEIFLASRNTGALKALQNELYSKNPLCFVRSLKLDLENEESIKALAGQMKTEAQYLDLIINNAGSLIKKDFSKTESDDIKRIMNVNYIGPALLIKECLPLLHEAEHPHIINIASMGGFQGSMKFPGLSHYSSSKAAIATLTECLAVEFKGTISVNCLAIGAVETEMFQEAFPGFEAPLKPEEMADFVYDFSRKGHKYMNGKILPVSVSNP
jgi:short-subunit dehydrogenase